MATNDHHLVYFTELTILMGLRIIVTQFALILQYFQFMIYLLINREEEGILGCPECLFFFELCYGRKPILHFVCACLTLPAEE